MAQFINLSGSDMKSYETQNQIKIRLKISVNSKPGSWGCLITFTTQDWNPKIPNSVRMGRFLWVWWVIFLQNPHQAFSRIEQTVIGPLF